MRYSQVEDFYKEVLAGNTVTVTVTGESEYNTIRTTLHRYHRSVVDLGGSELSLCSLLKGSEASFRLGPRKNKRKEYVFTVEEHGA